MNREWMQITLVKLGFTETDTQVYSFLATEGPHNAREMAEVLNLHRQKLYRSLKKLQNKGIVNASIGYPVTFSAVVFDRVLDLFIAAKMEQQQTLQKSKQELLSTWRSITKKDSWKS